MAKKQNSVLGPKSAVCKELNCFEAAAIKGFCRLHFLKVAAGNAEGDSVPKGNLKAVRDRRSSNRLKGLETEQGEDNELEVVDRVDNLGELDTDIEDMDLDVVLSGTKKKTG